MTASNPSATGQDRPTLGLPVIQVDGFAPRWRRGAGAILAFGPAFVGVVLGFVRPMGDGAAWVATLVCVGLAAAWIGVFARSWPPFGVWATPIASLSVAEPGRRSCCSSPRTSLDRGPGRCRRSSSRLLQASPEP